MEISIIGVRGYKIYFKNVDMTKYGFENQEQNESVKYYVRLISCRVMAAGLECFYHARSDLQRLVDDYYENLLLAYDIYKEHRKGKSNQREHDVQMAFVREKNAKIIKKIRKLNVETVDLMNFIDDCEETENYNFSYDTTHIDDYLKDEKQN